MENNDQVSALFDLSKKIKSGDRGFDKLIWAVAFPNQEKVMMSRQDRFVAQYVYENESIGRALYLFDSALNGKWSWCIVRGSADIWTREMSKEFPNAPIKSFESNHSVTAVAILLAVIDAMIYELEKGE